MYDAQCANDYKAYAEACAAKAAKNKRPAVAANPGGKKKPKYTKEQLEAMLAKAQAEDGGGEDTEESADA
eukprot:1823673-Alexandrium_andersonii.AAC.1